MMTEIEKLETLVVAVERAGVDIAPTYQEYMPMAFAVANSCGEQARALFHRLCALSPKYTVKDADKLFDNALKTGRNSNTLGTVWHLAERAGVEIALQPYNLTESLTHTRARTLYSNAPDVQPSEALPTENPAVNSDEEEEIIEMADEKVPDPLPDCDWPKFLQQGLDCGETKAQQDVLLLSMITTLGATMADIVCFFYGNRRLHPCLQVFLIAPPASGKGAMGWARHLADPIHEELARNYEQACAIYRNEKQKWDGLGKDRANQQEPEKPKRKLFFVSGDNTGTGIMENLIDQDGIGMISESEASILSAAISSDYGNWSHTLRKAFDHDGLSYNRRTNYEHRECKRLLLSVLISGTPGQVRPLIPSAENGLFSRELFYFMPPITMWKSQFNVDSRDYNALFERWGERWKRILDALHKQVSQLEMVLSPEQQDEFDKQLSQLFQHGGAMFGYAMRSAVARIAINLLRIMSVVGLLRALDDLLMTTHEEVLTEALEHLTATLLGTKHIEAHPDTSAENVLDGVVSSFVMHISDEDFRAVMSLALPLYRHSAHALSQLPEEKREVREATKQQRFISSLPMTFTRKEAVDIATSLGWSKKTCDTYLRRLSDAGTIQRTAAGEYCFTNTYN
jgi:hypothetical protein